MEDATVFADNFDWKRAFGATLTSDLPDPLRDAIEMDPHLGQGEISWSALNIPLPLYKRGLSWWEENYSCLGFDLGDLRTSYYWYRDNWFAQWYLGRSENEFLVQELQRTQPWHSKRITLKRRCGSCVPGESFLKNMTCPG